MKSYFKLFVSRLPLLAILVLSICVGFCVGKEHGKIAGIGTGYAVASALSYSYFITSRPVFGANSALATTASSPMIREYAQGAAQDQMALLKVADFLAPQVPVARMTGRYKRYSQKNRFRIPNTRRELNGKATRIGFSANDAQYTANIHALDFPVDNLEKLEEAEIGNLIMEASDMVAEVAALDWANEVVSAAIDVLTPHTSTWDANTDPVKAIDAQILALMKTTKTGGALNVRVLFGATAWYIFKNHPKVTGKFVSNAAGAANPQVTLPMAKSMLLTEPDIQVSYGVYDTAPEGVDDSIQFILDSNILIFMAKPKPTRLDPSFMKTFAPRGQFMVPGTYQLEDNRGESLKFDWNAVAEVTNEEAGYLMEVAES